MSSGGGDANDYPLMGSCPGRHVFSPFTLRQASRRGPSSSLNSQILDEMVKVVWDCAERNGTPSRGFHFGEFQGLQTVTESKSTNSTTSPRTQVELFIGLEVLRGNLNWIINPVNYCRCIDYPDTNLCVLPRQQFHILRYLHEITQYDNNEAPYCFAPTTEYCNDPRLKSRSSISWTKVTSQVPVLSVGIFFHVL